MCGSGEYFLLGLILLAGFVVYYRFRKPKFALDELNWLVDKLIIVVESSMPDGTVDDKARWILVELQRLGWFTHIDPGVIKGVLMKALDGLRSGD